MKIIGIIDQNFEAFDNEKDYDYILKTTDIDEAIKYLGDKDISEYTVEEYEADEDGEFVSGSDFDSAENFLKRNNSIRYWLETDANFDQYQADEEARKWALHKVVGDKDEVILSLAYSETPGFEGDKEQEPLDTSWKALDNYIKSELGFLPEYEVN